MKTILLTLFWASAATAHPSDCPESKADIVYVSEVHETDSSWEPNCKVLTGEAIYHSASPIYLKCDDDVFEVGQAALLITSYFGMPDKIGNRRCRANFSLKQIVTEKP